MIKTVRLVINLALLSLLAVTAFASVPATEIHVYVTTNLNTITWHVTNLTDDSSGFKLVRLDWLYPKYSITNKTTNTLPKLPWSFATEQLASNVEDYPLADNAVSWYTTVENGLGYNDKMDFTIESVPPVSTQEPYPVFVLWQRRVAPNGEAFDIGIGVTDVVPEPGSILALASGLIGMGGLITRRRK